MKTRDELRPEVSAGQGDASGGMPTVAGGAPVPGAAEPAVRSQWQLILRRFLRHRVALVSLVVLVAFYLIAILARQLAPFDLNPSGLSIQHGPTARHWFGTDELGRDQLTRVMFAARVSLAIGLFTALVSSVIGVVVGAFAGYFGGWLDQLLMRVTDLFLVVPAIAVVAIAQKGLAGKKLPVVGHVNDTTLIIVLLSFLFWQYLARVVRGLFLSIKEKEFIEAARASGASSGRVMFRHILPNIVGPIVVNTTLVVGQAVLFESTLSYLGLGLLPPTVSWGVMMNQSESAVGTANAYLIYFPGLCLLVTILCVNFLGDGLRDAFDPQSRH